MVRTPHGEQEPAVYALRREESTQRRQPFAAASPAYPTQTRAFLKIRIQGLSSAQLSGCQEFWSVR